MLDRHSHKTNAQKNREEKAMLSQLKPLEVTACEQSTLTILRHTEAH